MSLSRSSSLRGWWMRPRQPASDASSDAVYLYAVWIKVQDQRISGLIYTDVLCNHRGPVK